MNNRQSPFDVLLGEVQSLEKAEDISLWLIKALSKRSPEAITLPTRGERHIFIEKLYTRCEPLLQIKFSSALAIILEDFEPRPNPGTDDLDYLYSLLSLAAVIRNDRIKERLRRWLYDEAFHEWQHKIFNLHGVLILTTSVYDSDEEWLYFIKRKLPTKPYFGTVAAEAYSALQDTKGLECLELLPDCLNTIEITDKNIMSRFRILLSDTLERCAPEFFFMTVAKLLSAKERDVANVCLNVLKLEHLIEGEFRDQKQFDKWTDYLGEKVWQPALERWRKDGTDPEVFARILKEGGTYDILRKGWIGPYKILTFNNGRHEITVRAKDKKFSPFFEHFEYHDEIANEPEIELTGAAAEG
jgi:hypothetical protein